MTLRHKIAERTDHRDNREHEAGAEMGVTEIALHATVFVAALLQAITGIGFAMIAGPFILLVMNSGSAIQVTTLLSLLIALILAPMLHTSVDREILKRFLIGTVFGLPVGIAIFLSINVDVLKLLAGLAVLFMTVSVLASNGRRSTGTQPQSSSAKDLAVGGLSGAMSACLAMPGPVPAVHMSAHAIGKETIRATILALFVGSYSAAFLIQASVVGVASETLILTLSFVPATLIGVIIGRVISKWISETHFRWLIIAFLLATSASLLIASMGALLWSV